MANVEGSFDPESALEVKTEGKTEGNLDEIKNDFIELLAKWGSQTISVFVRKSSCVLSLKQHLAQVTGIQPHRQKLVGFKFKGKVTDEMAIEQLQVTDKHKFMLIGTAEQEILPEPPLEDNFDVVNDLDYDYSILERETLYDYDPQRDETNQLKLFEAITSTKIQLINPLRAGKKLLVLDLDYTLFDMKSQAASFADLKRPFTDEFLSAVYPFYDICVWSQTSWRWLELKLTELGLLTHPNYRISFVLDKTSMFSITSKHRDGSIRKHHVKPLQIIWHHIAEFDRSNTIHIDDLGRNFAMNPANGLKIGAYKRALEQRATDQELLLLARYLTLIASLPSFENLRHAQWKEFLRQK
eukprot:TRINITY_DN13030_c0_g2_i1.p1 TRINITY_DN13030_c0_g2~~TRINITY_DN13030_c0_g2_i1.p1  ORF type:complete len:355 (+),score=45.58 TRINITY_DN13030_c0_g2_i1:80-1144(+)